MIHDGKKLRLLLYFSEDGLGGLIDSCVSYSSCLTESQIVAGPYRKQAEERK